jgi:hypothetical protein
MTDARGADYSHVPRWLEQQAEMPSRPTGRQGHLNVAFASAIPPKFFFEPTVSDTEVASRFAALE